MARSVVPASGLREAVQLLVQRAPAVDVEGLAIRRRRAVEGELLAGGERDALELLLAVRSDDERGAHDLDVRARAARLREPALERRHDALEERAARVEGMRDEPVRHLPRDPDHARAEARHEHRRRAERAAATASGRNGSCFASNVKAPS